MIKILIGDDSQFVQDRLARMLMQEGFEVRVAANGIAAVECYQQEHPQVVLLDINMPVKNGLGALEDILAYDPRANVIMVTALLQANALTAAIRLGAKDFLVKPIGRENLLLTISKVLNQELFFSIGD